MVVAFVMVGEVVIKQLNPLPNDFLEEKRTKDRFINLYEIAQSDEKKSFHKTMLVNCPSCSSMIKR
jgi:hypothetical protein